MRLAIFDFDGTLISRDTLPCLGREWLRQKRSRWRYTMVWMSVIPVVLLYKLRLMPRENMKSAAFKGFNRIFTGMSSREIEAFFRQAYPNLKQYFNPAVLSEISEAQDDGYYCLLLSGAYEGLLQLIADDLGIDLVIGSQLAFKEGIFDPQGEARFVDGEGKRTLLLEAFADRDVDWEGSKAFGDSFADILIMETVGERVAVNPDLALLDYARKNSWRVVAG